MKPAFALDLDNDSVTLLQRSAVGWLRVGSVGFSDADLDGALARLKGQAAALAPEGFTSKLILPPSQVLYTEVDAPGPDRAARRATIAEALKGRTPYEVTELVFDFTRSGDRAKVAVVAQVTLDEAEGFAETHGFNPVCIVAVPKDGAFGGEPFFGLTARAGEHVPEGSHLDRDQEPVRVTGDAPALPEAVAVVVEEAVAPVAEVAEAVAVVESEPVFEAEPVAEPELVAEAELAEEPEPVVEAAAEELAALVPAPADEAVDAAADQPDEDIAAEAATVEEEPVAAALPVLEAVAGRMQAAEQAADLPAPDAPEPEEEAPFIAIDDAEEGEPITVIGEAMPEPSSEPSPETALAAFQTRRASTRADDEDDLRAAENRLHLTTADPIPDFATAPVIEGVAAITAPELDVPPLQSEQDEADEGTTLKRRVGALGRPVLNSSLPDAVHGTMAQQKLRHAGAAPPIAAPATPAPPRPRRTAPARQTAPATGRSSGRVLLALTGILVAAMVTLGLASAWFSGGDEPTAVVTPTETTPAETAPAAPAAEDAATVDEAVPPSDSAEADPLPETAPDAVDAAPEPDVSATDAAVADALTEPAAEPVVAPPADVADTPPASSPLPEADASGAPAIAQSPATPDGAGGPNALPDAQTAASDAPPAAQPVPPPFGTVMQFDSAGMIVPTAEGVITPDGFTLYSGRPPKVPPARPATAAPTALPAAAPATTDPAAAPAPADPAATAAPGDGAALAPAAAPLPPADPALAGKKPRTRPASIALAATAAHQKAEALAEAAAAAAKAEAERTASATPQAVASSRRPAGRPSGLVVPTSVQPNAVDAAVAAAVAEPLAPAPAAPVAAPAPAPAPQPEVVATAAPKPAPEPEPAASSFSDEVSEPDLQGTPNMPTTRTVAKQATIKNAINLSEVSLIGVYGSSSNRRALVRMPSGRFVKVKVGDRLDGGTIAAIGDSEVSYVKKGRTIVLKMARSG